MTKLFSLTLLIIAAPMFAALPENSDEFLANASRISPMAFAPEPDAPVVFNAKFGQFSYRTSEKKSFTLNLYEVFTPTVACFKEVQRNNISYFLMVIDPENRKIYKGSSQASPELINPDEFLTEENLLFYRKN